MAQDWFDQVAAPVQQPTQRPQTQYPGVIQGRPKQPDPYQVQKDAVSQANEATRLGLEELRTQIAVDKAAQDKKEFDQKQAEAAAKQEVMERAKMDAKFQILGVVDAARQAKRRSNEWFATGFGAETAKDLGGTAASDVDALLNTIGANTAFDRLQKMRDESPTGGALGQVTEMELRLLRDSVASLKQSQSDEQFRANMDKVINAYARVYKGLTGEDVPPEREDGGDDQGGALNVTVTDTGDGGGSAPQPPDAPADRDNILGYIDAGVRGAADTLTLGLADKISAVMATIGTGGTYADNLARERAINEVDNENSYARMIGQLGGAMAFPMGRFGTIGQSAAKGAGYGGTYAFNSQDTPFTERVPETLAGVGLGAAGGVGGFYLGKGVNALANRQPRGAGEVSENMNALLAGQRQGIPMRQPDIRPSTRADFAGVEASPSGNPIVTRALEGDQRAIQSRLREIGGSGQPLDDRFRAGETVQEAGKRYIVKTREQANSLYRRAQDLAGGATVKPSGAIATLDRHIAELTENGAKTNAGQIRYLNELREDILDGTLSIEKFRSIRTSARGQISERNLTMTDAERRVGEVMEAASHDIEAALMSNPNALGAYKNADAFYREKQDFIKQVAQKFLGPRNQPMSAEQAASRLNSMIKEGGDSERFRRMWDQLEPMERADLQATFAEGLGRGRNGDFSITALATNMRNINPRTARAVFGEDGFRALRDLQAIAEAKTATASSLNRSRTGVVEARNNKFKDIILGVFGGSVGGVPGAIAGMAGRSGLEAFSSRRAARLLLNPDFTKWLRNTPNTTNPKAINRHFERLNQIASASPVIKGDAKALQEFLAEAFSRSPYRATAGDNEPEGRLEPPQQ